MYDNKGKEVCNNIIKNNFSKTATLKKLRLRDLAGKAKNLIIDKTVTRKEELGEADPYRSTDTGTNVCFLVPFI